MEIKNEESDNNIKLCSRLYVK